MDPTATGSGESLFTTDRSAATMIVVVSVSVLFAALGSVVALVTLTMLVMVPVAIGVTTMATGVLVTAMVPRSQVTMPPDSLQLPWPGVADTKVTLAGKVSVRVTAVELAGPLLVTVRVYTRPWPATAGLAEEVFSIASSVTSVMAVSTTALSLLWSGSSSLEKIAAVFVIASVVDESTRTSIVVVAASPTDRCARDPTRAQLRALSQ